MPRFLDRADEHLGAAWWGDAPARARREGWSPSGSVRGSDPDDYRVAARATEESSAAGRTTGEQAVMSGTPSRPVGSSPPAKQPDPQPPSQYSGEGNYTYRVAPNGDIYILQSGYGGGRDYTEQGGKRVARGSTAYNAIVDELNKKHGLSLQHATAPRPQQAKPQAGAGAGGGVEGKPDAPIPPKNDAPPRTAPSPGDGAGTGAGGGTFDMEADAAARPSAAPAVEDLLFDMQNEPPPPPASAPRGPVMYAGPPPGGGGSGLESKLDRMVINAGAAAKPGAPQPVYNRSVQDYLDSLEGSQVPPLFAP